MKKIIEFKDFTFKYQAQQEPTLKDIQLSIYQGEKVLIIGPSHRLTVDTIRHPCA